MKKPVITYREDELYKKTYSKLYPCFNAREVPEITAAIEDAITYPKKRQQMGEKAYVWVKTNFIQKPLQHLLGIIQSTS